LVTALENKRVKELACGESNYALTVDGDLYVWGLYNEIFIKSPSKLIENSDLVQIVSSSDKFTAAIDKFHKLWVGVSESS